MINIVYFISTVLIWSGSFVAVKMSLSHIDPICAAFLRVFIATVFITIYVLIFKIRLLKTIRINMAQVLAAGFGISLPFACLFYAQKEVSPGLAGIINSTVPIWVTIFSIFFPQDRALINKRVIAGVFLGFLGIIVLNGDYLISEPTHYTLTGMGLLIAMAISYALGACINRVVMGGTKKKIDLVINLLVQLSIATLLLLAFTNIEWIHIKKTMHNATSLYALLYLGVFSTGVAFIFYFNLVKNWGSLKATSVVLFIPPISFVLDYIFFANTPSNFNIAGSIVILSSVMLIKNRKSATTKSA